MKDIVTKILIGFIFYAILTPLGIVRRSFGKEFLVLNFNRDQTSYWNYRGKTHGVSTSQMIDSSNQYVIIKILKTLFKIGTGFTPGGIAKKVDKLPEDMYTI